MSKIAHSPISQTVSWTPVVAGIGPPPSECTPLSIQYAPLKAWRRVPDSGVNAGRQSTLAVGG
jgi:hypothetical protein